MTSVVGSPTLSPGLSGTTWPISHAAVGAGQVVVAFLAVNVKAATPVYPSGSTSWVELVNSGHSIAPHRGAIAYKIFPSGSAATSFNVTFATATHGHAFTVVLDDAVIDSVSASATEVTAGGVNTITVDAITGASASSIYLTFAVAEFYRDFSHSGGLTTSTQKDFVPTANGGISSALGYKTSGAGSITGGTWTMTDPFAGSGEARTSTWAVIFEPSAAPTNPAASGSIYAPDATADDPPDNPTTAATVTVASSTSVNVTVSGWDVTADTIYITAALVTGGVTGSYATVGSAPVSGISFPLVITGLSPGATYKFGWYVGRDGTFSVLGAPATANITLQGLFCYMYADASALGVSGVDAQVFRLPSAGYLAGETIGKGSALTFDAALVGGRARLRIPMTQPTTGALLTNGQTVAAVARKSVSGTSQIWTRITVDAVITEV